MNKLFAFLASRPSTLRSRILIGTGWNIIATGFNQGSTLIANIVVARILPTKGFGEYSMIQTTLLTLAVLAQLAMGYTANKYVAEYRSSNPEKASRILGVCFAVTATMAGFWSLLLIVNAKWLSANMLKAPHLAGGLIIGSIFLFFSAINGCQTGTLVGLEGFVRLAKAGVLSGIIAVLGTGLGTSLWGLEGAFAGLAATGFLRCAVHYWFVRRELRDQNLTIRYRGIWSENSVIWRFAVPAAMAGYYSMPMIWFANSLLVRRPDGYSLMAMYASANNLKILALVLPNMFNTVSLSILNHIKGNGDLAKYHSLFRTNVAIISGTAVGCAFFVGAFGKSILGIFGKTYSGGTSILNILLLAGVLEAMSTALYQYIQSQGKIWNSLLLINFPREALLVLLAAIFVSKYGASGLARAFVGAYAFGILSTLSLVFFLKTKNREKSPSAQLDPVRTWVGPS